MQARIHLSPNQKGALVAARRAMLANIGALLAEREQLGARIRVRTSPAHAMHGPNLSESSECATICNGTFEVAQAVKVQECCTSPVYMQALRLVM